MAKTNRRLEKPRLIHFLMVLILAAIWGSSFVAMKVAVDDLGSLGTAVGRVTIGFLALLPWALYRGLIWPSSLRQWGLVVVVALFGTAIPFTLIGAAVHTLTSGKASLLLASATFFSLALGHFFTEDDRLHRYKIIGSIVGFLGLAYVVSPDLTSGQTSGRFAILAGVLAAASYAVAGTSLRFVHNMPAARLSCLTLAISFPVVLLNYLVFSPAHSVEFSKDATLAILYLGFIPTALASLFRLYLIPRIGVTWFSQSLNLIPIFGVALGAIILDEAIHFSLIVGLVLVLLGLGISRISGKNDRE